MRSYVLTASALSALASAQTFTKCNPMEKQCPNNPAIAKTFETNFKDGKDALKGWQKTAGDLDYVEGGAEFTVKQKGDAPTIQSDGYLHFGYIEVTMKAAPGAGIISSIVLESDDLDEVDWEFIGSEQNKAQMNYFGKGNTTTYDRMIKADVPNFTDVHRYALNWTADALTWIIDDAPVRTLKYGDANGGKNFPQTPCNVRIGIWAGGDSPDQGTRDWAGGNVDYSKAPFKQTVEKVKIINYSPGKEYEWTDKSGSWQSIKVIDGEGVEGGSSKDKPSGSAAGNATATATTSCTEEGTPSSTPPPAEETPCDCDVLTVTVTGPPPEATPETSSQVSTPPPQPTPETSSSVSSSSTESVPTPPATSDSPPPPSSTPESSSAASSSSTSCTESTTSSVPTPPATSDSPPPPVVTPQTSSVPSNQTTPCTTSTPPPPPPPVETSSKDNCTSLVTTTVPPPYPTGGIAHDTNPPPSVPYPTNPTGAIPVSPPNGTSPPIEQFPGAASTMTISYALALVAGALVFAL